MTAVAPPDVRILVNDNVTMSPKKMAARAEREAIHADLQAGA